MCIRDRENLNLPQGVILGVKKKNGIDYAMVDDEDVHTLMIGAAGCGKTAFWLYPNLEYACAAGMSLLTTDTKGDPVSYTHLDVYKRQILNRGQPVCNHDNCFASHQFLESLLQLVFVFRICSCRCLIHNDDIRIL